MLSIPIRTCVVLLAGMSTPLIAASQVCTATSCTIETTDVLPNLNKDPDYIPASYFLGTEGVDRIDSKLATTKTPSLITVSFTDGDFSNDYRLIDLYSTNVSFDTFNLHVQTNTLTEISAIEFCDTSADFLQDSLTVSLVNSSNSNYPRATIFNLLDNSSINYTGRINLQAFILKDTLQLGDLARIYGSDNSFSIKTTGQSRLVGNIGIEINNQNSGSLILSKDGDMFIGNIYRNRNSVDSTKPNFSLTLEKGTVWKPTGDNTFSTFNWNSGAIIDLTPTKGLLGNATLTPGKVLLDIDNITVKDNAILRIAITDEKLDTTEPYLVLNNTEPIKSAHVFVDFVDERSNLVDRNNIAIPFIWTGYGSGKSNLTFERIPHEFETALGRYETNIAIGTDAEVNTEVKEKNSSEGSALASGYYITSIQTQLLGPSSMADNFVDTVSTSLIATENVVSRTQARTIERLLFPKERGLWVDAGYSQTKLTLADETRTQKLKTQHLTMGWDTDFQAPFMHETFGGVYLNVAKNDIEMNSGDAESDYYGGGIYAGGLTPQKEYRLLFQAHWGKADTDFNHMFSTTHEKYQFNSDAQTYGVGLYVGFNRYNDENPQTSPWMWEPFMSGHTYWIKPQTTSFDQGVRFKTEKNHQSVVRLGLTVAYDEEESFKGYGQIAAAHRFGKSVNIIGQEQQTQQTFQTEELQETWGELTLYGAYHYSRNLELGLRTTFAKAQEVEPEFDFSLSAQYRF